MKNMILFALLAALLVGAAPTAPAVARAAAPAAGPGTSAKVTPYYVPNDNKTKAILNIKVTTADYRTGVETEQTYEYPEFGIPLAAGTSLDDDDGTPRLLDAECGPWTQAMMFKLSGGAAAVWEDCTVVIDAATGKKLEPARFRLMAFDLATKKAKVLREAESGQARSRFQLSPDFNGYVLEPDDPNAARSDFKRANWQIYSLETNKLIGTSYREPSFISADPNQYYRYDRMPLSSSLIVQTLEKSKVKLPPKTEYGTFYEKDAKGVDYIVRNFEMTSDGRKTELFQNKNIDKVWWSVKAGAFTFANYYDAKTKLWRIGYAKGKSYVPLTPAGYKTKTSVSPNGGYLLVMTTTPKDTATGKTTSSVLVVDTRTAKVVHTLPDFESYKVEPLFEWVSDKIVKVEFAFSAKPNVRYIDLETGIATVMHEPSNPDGYFSISTHAYSGSLDDLLSPDRPYQINIDDKRMTYTGQGPFQRMTTGTGSEEWFVPLNDFTGALGAKLTAGGTGWNIERGEHAYRLDKKKTLSHRGRVYAPLADLADNLGLFAGVVAGDRMRQIYLFSEGLTEAQYKRSLEPKPSEREYEYRDGKWTTVTVAEANRYAEYSVNWGLAVSFLDGKIASLKVETELAHSLRGIAPVKDASTRVVAKYGAKTATKVGSSQALVYASPNAATMFLLDSKKKVERIYYRALP
ncbi:hypothetical protein [Cohnella sp. GCM10027633]|uniref:hypothetical protein n=1 Tax=unclassified Cohnella TaxID=2636738 RepID=UPI00362BF1E6